MITLAPSNSTIPFFDQEADFFGEQVMTSSQVPTANCNLYPNR